VESFGRSAFGFTIMGACFFSVVLSLALLFLGRGSWIPGLWAGVLWIAAKAWLMHRMMTFVSKPRPEDRKKLFAFAFVAFPVLYLAGFYLLLTDWIALEGVFFAFTLFFMTFVAGWIYRSAKPKVNG